MANSMEQTASLTGLVSSLKLPCVQLQPGPHRRSVFAKEERPTPNLIVSSSLQQDWSVGSVGRIVIE